MRSDKRIRELERQARQGVPGAAERLEVALAQAGRSVDYSARAMAILDALRDSQGGDHSFLFAEHMEPYDQSLFRQDRHFDRQAGNDDGLDHRFLLIENGVCMSFDELWAHGFDTLEELLDHVHDQYYQDYPYATTDHGMFPWYPRVIVDLLLMQPLDFKTCYEVGNKGGTVARHCGPWLMPEARDYWNRVQSNPPGRRSQARELERLVRKGQTDLWPELVRAKEREGLMPGRAWVRSWPSETVTRDTTLNGRPYQFEVHSLGEVDRNHARSYFRGSPEQWRQSLFSWASSFDGVTSELVLLHAVRLQSLVATVPRYRVTAYLFDSPGGLESFSTGPLIPEAGDRVKLLSMTEDEPDPIRSGATGTVLNVGVFGRGSRAPWEQIGVDWDAPHQGRDLAIVAPPDKFRILWGERA